VRVLKKPLVPNAFSPNGDGINDTWVIEYLETYPGAVIEVFNRYGQVVFRSVGYDKPWDGTYKGQQLPTGTYYYIINPKNGREQMNGWVVIIR
jgi:gliding motility-associated-like protein